MLKHWTTAFWMAWAMFLAIPCPVWRWDKAERGRMLALLPVIGLAVGLLWAAAAWLRARYLGAIPLLGAVLVAAIPWLATGFLHLDGFLDVSDATLSCRDREGMLRILKDPHCGSFAVLSAVLLATLQIAVFADAPRLGGRSLLALALVPVATRAAAAFAVSTFRPLGTSQYAEAIPNALAARASAVFFFVFATVCSLLLCGRAGAAPLAAALAYALAAWRTDRKLGGMSGDVSGYALVLGELVGAAVAVLGGIRPCI